MNKKNNKNDFFGLNRKEAVGVVEKALKEANKEQFELIKRQGGIGALKKFYNHV